MGVMDFDAAQRERQAERERELGDRSFTLRGETFTFVPNARYDVLKRVSALAGDTDGSQIIGVLEEAVLDLIEDTPGAGEGVPSAHDRFRAVVAREDFPVTFQDLNEIASWLIEKQVNRPTQPPSPSTDGQGLTGTPSTDISSSTPAVDSTG